MTTPYATALRVRRREIDQLRIRIAAEIAREMEIETARTAAERAALSEREALISLGLACDGYFARLSRERLALDEARQQVGAQLDALRVEAREGMGALRAMESAEADFVGARERARTGAEQAAVDDRAAALTARRARPRAESRP